MKNILDREALLERVQGDKELAKELLEMFLEDVPGRLKIIHQAKETGDMKRITLEAHTIKGSSGNIGANDMSEAAFQLELAGKDENQQSIPSLINTLEEKFKVFQQTLSDIDTILAE